MGNQVIISIGREFGSGGHVIAESLAERFRLPLYDSNILEEVASERQVDAKRLRRYDEVPRNILFSRRVNGHSNSAEENIAWLQFEYLKKKAAAGESFVVVGRCAETMLAGTQGLITIFVLGDPEVKKNRIMELHQLSEKEARSMIDRQDRQRKMYHNYYSKVKWGDSRNYDLCINSSRMGIERTADFLESYVRERMRER
ncbi:MAG: cytidylate kinase-like family protein [Eubacteriales bacterium]|nr:cytidylate kinase-like family protein [Eubacteriales bacterium]